ALRPVILLLHLSPYFFFTTTSTPEIYTLSLHDALPIWGTFSQRKKSVALLNPWLQGRGKEDRTRREPIRGGSIATSMSLMVLPPFPRPCSQGFSSRRGHSRLESRGASPMGPNVVPDALATERAS